MVELLQNIILHGKMNIEDKKYSPGIFFISRKDNIFHLNSINYIKNKDKQAINLKLQKLNTLNEAELEELYSKELFDFSDDGQHAGLGFIEMRMKSRNKLLFNFETINDNYSIFTLKLTFKDN